MSDAVTNIFKLLEEKRMYLKGAVDYFVKENIQLNRATSFELVERIGQKNLFYWHDLAGYLLQKNAVANEEFLNVLLTVMRQDSGVLADNLVQIGYNTPDIALAICNKAREIKKPELFFCCRWIVGGLGKRDFKQIYKMILEDIGSPSSELRISALTAIMVAFGERMEPEWADKVFQLLQKVKADPDQQVKIELLRVYSTLYKYSEEVCFSSMIELSKQNEVLKRVASLFMSLRGMSKPHYQSFLEEMSQSDDKTVLENVSLAMYKLASDDVKSELKVVRRVLKSHSFFEIPSLNMALNKLGEIDLETCLKALNSWVEEKDVEIEFAAPTIAVEVSKKDTSRLVDSLISSMDNEKLFWFTFKTSRILLNEIYDRSSDGKKLLESDEKTVGKLLSKLKNVAQNRGFDSEGIARREELTIFKCLILIETIEHEHGNLDYGTIWRNLNHFPNIREFMGEKWFKQMEKEHNRTHPLLVYLSDSCLDEREFERKVKELENLEKKAKYAAEVRLSNARRTRALLAHLEKEIGEIKASAGLRNTKASLRQEEHFWKSFSEIDVASRLATSGYQVAISPSLEVQQGSEVKIKRPDLRMIYNDDEVYIEVISPDMFPPLRYFHAAGIPNRTRGKITEEIKKHFGGMKIEQDVIIIIDFGDSEMQYASIQDYVKGEPQFVFRVNRETGEVIETFNQRGKTMTEKDEDTRIIIGIIGYSRIMGTDGQIHLKGRMFPSPKAAAKVRILESVAKNLLG